MGVHHRAASNQGVIPFSFPLTLQSNL